MVHKNIVAKRGLTRAREAYRAMPEGTSLKTFLIVYGRNYSNPTAMAKDMGVSFGSVLHILNGKIQDSPTLREALCIPKNPKRWRWIVQVDEQDYLFLSSLCEELGVSRTKLLMDSVDLYLNSRQENE